MTSISDARPAEINSVAVETGMKKNRNLLAWAVIIERGVIAPPVRNGELYDMPAAEAGKCNELPILQRF